MAGESTAVLVGDAVDDDLAAVSSKRVLVVAAAYGVVGSSLVHPVVWDGAPPGVGVALVGVLTAALLLSGEMTVGRVPSPMATRLAVGTAMFSALVAVRSSPTLEALNVAAAFLCAMAAVTTFTRPTVAVTVSDLGYATVRAVGGVLHAPLRIVPAALRRPEQRYGRTLLAVVGGLLIAMPLLWLFAALFASADEVFASGLRRITTFDAPPGLTTGAFLAVVMAVGAIGALGASREPMAAPPETVPTALMHSTTATTVLVAVNALFAAFVITQIGEAVLSYGHDGTRYAELARRGFFQLVAVGAIVVALVLSIDYLAKPSGAERRIDRLNGTLIALTAAVLVSALVRMMLYVRAFGLTELRVYTTAFMVWVAFILAWTTVTVLRGRRDRFTWPVATAALGIVLVLNVANPDGLIASYNITHIGNEAARVDADYLAESLSVDAAPAVLDRLDVVDDPCDRATLAGWLLEVGDRDDGWRSWDLAGHEARGAVGESRASLLAALGAC